MLAPQEKKLTIFFASALLQFTVTVLYLSFYYNILEVSVLTKFNKILLLFVTNKTLSGWSVSKEICHDEWINPWIWLWRQAQSWRTSLFFDAINCISRYLQTNNWGGLPLAKMQQSTCCVPPLSTLLTGQWKCYYILRYFLVLRFALTKLLHFALACVASVSVRCKSKERGTRVKDREKNGSRFISPAAKTGISLLRNQAKWKLLPRMQANSASNIITSCVKSSYILRYYYTLWRNRVSQRNVLWNVEKMQAAPWTLLLLVFLIKLSCLSSEFLIDPLWSEEILEPASLPVLLGQELCGLLEKGCDS